MTEESLPEPAPGMTEEGDSEEGDAVRLPGSGERAIEKIGVFGGTFDPPHVGHIAAAEAARAALALHRVIFVVANVPWQKGNGEEITAAAQRLALVQAAVSQTEGFEVSRAEIDRGGDSYTAETLRELAAPGRKLYLILGSDLAPGLNTWKSPDVIRSLATVAVVGRLGGSEPSVPPAGWDWVPVRGPGIEVSSTEIRNWLLEGRPLPSVLTAGVSKEIRRLGLYRDRDGGVDAGDA